MKTNIYKIEIIFRDNSKKVIQATQRKIQADKTVINYVFGRFSKNTIKCIKTRCYNETRENYYWTLNYSLFFEYAKERHFRVEAINKPGHEDITGYGNRTNGIKNRFYIGRSTGWIPIYLEILTNRSFGCSSLYTGGGREFKYLYHFAR